MPVFTGHLTRRQIIDQALKKAGPTKVLVEARLELADRLEKLYVQHEWPFLYQEASLTLTASTALPDRFLQPDADPETALRVTAVDGVTEDHPILLVTPQEWRRRAIPRAETATVPDIAMIDFTTNVLKPWPIPESSVVALLVYKQLPAHIAPTDIATFDADTPVFPYSGVLVAWMEKWAFEYDHNTTQALAAEARYKDELARALGMANPLGTNRSDSIPLDPATFRPAPRYNDG